MDNLDDEFLLGDQLDELPAPEPLIEGVLSRHAYGIICGRDATFKTFIALDWALSGHRLISAGTLTAYRIGPRLIRLDADA